MSLSSRNRTIKRLLSEKSYRDAYVLEHIKNGVAFQIRTNREDRGWTQGKLGEVANKPRNVISRLEDPNYGKFTLATLLEIASAFDMGLLVKFVPFSRLVKEYEDVSPNALLAKSVTDETEMQNLAAWAAKEVFSGSVIPMPALRNIRAESGIAVVGGQSTTSDRVFEPEQQVLFLDKPRQGQKRRRRNQRTIVTCAPEIVPQTQTQYRKIA